MKRFLIVISVLLLLVGCSSTSSSELQEAQKARSEAEEKYSTLFTEHEELQKDYESLQKEYSAYKEKMVPYEELSEAEAEAARIEAEKTIQAEKEAEQARKEAEEAEKAAKEAAGYESGITYDQLARTPDDYEGEKVKFRGKVIQVIEGDDEIQIRLAVNSNYDTVILCGYEPDLVTSRVLEDDIITVYGISVGLFSYQSTLGGTITIPAVWVERIDQ
ncbi:MAG: hypothetical protein IKE21_06930 [Erysipelotrichaceae bacterium]|nr:hypothetical protein [Erysipelotrichaceae bacterium]